MSKDRAYRLVFDTGATDTVFDQKIARRDLEPWSGRGDSLSPSAGGLHGEISLSYYAGVPLKLGDWTAPLDRIVAATDMSDLSQQIGTHVDGVLGFGTIAELNWIWDRTQHVLRGYRAPSAFFNQRRSKLECVQMKLTEANLPLLPVRVANEDGWFVLDTGSIGGGSGNLSAHDIEFFQTKRATSGGVTRRDGKHLSGKPTGPLSIVRVDKASLGPLQLDGLVFEESRLESRFGIGFLYKFERVALDFKDGKFCFSASSRVEPDTLPTQAELDNAG